MPTVNLTARKLRVRIGADLQDWSAAAVSFTADEAGLSEDGLKPIEGQLILADIKDAPESIDPYDNPARWHPGTPVLIEVANDSGAWVVPRYGRLFILEEPDYPEPGQPLTIQVGCKLAWHNTFEFDDDQTGVTVGTATNSATVAQNLLEANEILIADISLGTWPYSLTLPEGKGPSGSFVQQAGGLAYSNDWRYLWQRADGVITASALDLSIGSPLVTITLGVNDVAYSRVKVEGTPPNSLKVAGVARVASAGTNPSVEVNEVEGDLAPFSEGAVTCVGIGVIARSTTTVSWSGDSLTGWTHVTQTVEEGIRSAVAYTPSANGGSPCTLTEWRRTTVTRQYGTDRRLIDVTTLEEQRAFTLNQTLLNRGFFNWYTTRETVETYYPDVNEILERLEVVEQAALVTLDSSYSGAPNTATDPARLITVDDRTFRWTQLGTNTWRKTESFVTSKALTNTAPGADPTATVGRTLSTTSNSGQTQPPQVEFWDDGINESETEYQYTLTYTPVVTGRVRKDLKILPFGFSEAQCQTMAEHHIRLAIGRNRAAVIEFPFSNTLLSAPPMFPCDVVLPSGEIRHYRIDGINWEHTPDQAKLAGTGILVGVTPAPTLENPTPSPIPTYTP